MLTNLKIINTKTGKYYDPNEYVVADGKMFKSGHDFLDGKYEDPEEVKIIRSTEYYDCNGQEIFEDDVVRLNFVYGSELTGVVAFYSGNFFILRSHEDLGIFTYQPLSLKGKDRTIEVIGNIYNNKELLHQT